MSGLADRFNDTKALFYDLISAKQSFKFISNPLWYPTCAFSTAHRCYERPSNTSTADCSVNCTHPENLCFKHSDKGEEDNQVTIQGCMSADQCSKHQSKHLECCEGDFCNKGKTNYSHELIIN